MAIFPFDFNTYLEQTTGLFGWSVEELSGGAANFTVRVRPPPGAGDVFGSEKSVVIKQAPPYFAKLPKISFSPYRQIVEREALELFHSLGHDANSLQTVLASNPLVHIPRMLKHDSQCGILVQSDLGSHPNLYEVLISSHTFTTTASRLGSILGHFLADMHNSPVLSPLNIKAFDNDDSERVIVDVISRVASYLKDAGVADWEILGEAASNHWRNRRKTAFSQGDLWFGTVLVDINESSSSNFDKIEASRSPVIGICDWEFAGPNAPSADIAQLGSYLHLLSVSPLTTASVNRTVIAFAEALYSSYFAIIKKPLDRDFLSSLLLMHGWEMVNAAAWGSRQDMWCRCEGEGVRCEHIKSMVENGSKLMRLAIQTGDVDMKTLRSTIEWSRFFSLNP